MSTGWRVAGAALAVALGLPVLLASMPSYAAVDRDVACVEIEDSGTEETYRTDDASLPLAALGIERAHRA